jgi:hypothetical protein
MMTALAAILAALGPVMTTLGITAGGAITLQSAQQIGVTVLPLLRHMFPAITPAHILQATMSWNVSPPAWFQGWLSEVTGMHLEIDGQIGPQTLKVFDSWLEHAVGIVPGSPMAAVFDDILGKIKDATTAAAQAPSVAIPPTATLAMVMPIAPASVASPVALTPVTFIATTATPSPAVTPTSWWPF